MILLSMFMFIYFWLNLEAKMVDIFNIVFQIFIQGKEVEISIIKLYISLKIAKKENILIYIAYLVQWISIRYFLKMQMTLKIL